MRITVLDDAEALATAAAARIAAAIRAGGARYALCLSGGSTPKRAYELLAERHADLPWHRVHLFWGDERFVPADDPRSNQRMVRLALLDHIAMPPENIHAVPTSGTAEQAAAAYDATLRAFGERRPFLFDLMLLGLGTNGHTASLFPDQPALDERTAWAVATTPPGEPTRITLTYPALENTADALFLVAGADKAPMMARVAAGDASIPAGRLRPRGELEALVDRAAMG